MPDQRARAGATTGVDGAAYQGREQELLTVDDVCAWFKVNRDWVYDEVESGRLPYLRLGRKHLRFDRGELLAYLTAAGPSRSTARQPPPASAPGTPGLEPLQ